MVRLRSPDGCPWDREQTYETLRPYVLEEAYEVVDAIDRGDARALAEEVGDLLFEGVFLAQIASERRDFTVVDALGLIVDKLVRRHPHVFGRRRLHTAAAVVEQWEALKARERAAELAPRTTLDGVPRALPALLRAYEIGTRVAAVGFDWPAARDVIDKIEEEVAELRGAVADRSAPQIEEEMGDLLFAIANLARKLGVEPESALRRANDKFTRRFGAVEARLRAQGIGLNDAGLERLEREWGDVKD
jgi:MazG family protein